jgi:hypothetical protein
MGSLLPACSFGHVRREANQVVHALGQRALGKEQAVVMRFRVPPYISRYVEREAKRPGGRLLL